MRGNPGFLEGRGWGQESDGPRPRNRSSVLALWGLRFIRKTCKGGQVSVKNVQNSVVIPSDFCFVSWGDLFHGKHSPTNNIVGQKSCFYVVGRQFSRVTPMSRRKHMRLMV